MATHFLNGYSKVEEQEGLISKGLDVAQYGLVDTVISAGTSFYNTAVSFGNLMGADWEQAETEETIRNAVGDGAADYYQRHHGGIDLAGLVVGSLVPGLASIKAARALTGGISATSTSRILTGIRNVAVPEHRLNAITTGIRNNALARAIPPHKLSLAAHGFANQAWEAAMYEIGMVTTMNQNSALNPDQLDYFDAIAANAQHMLVGTLFGGALGGGVQYALHTRALSKALQAEDEALAKMAYAPAVGALAMLGDNVASKLKDYGSQLARQKDTSILSPEQRGALAEQSRVLDNSINNLRTDIIGTINRKMRKSEDDHDWGSILVEQLDEASRQGLELTPAKLSELVEGATYLRGVSIVNNRRGTSVNVAHDASMPGSQSLLTGFSRDFDEVSLEGITFPAVRDKAGKEIKVIDKERRAVLRQEFDGEGLMAQGSAGRFLEAQGALEAEDVKILFRPNTKVRVALKGEGGKKLPISGIAPEDLTLFQLPRPRKNKQGVVVPPENLSTLVDVWSSMQSLVTHFDPYYARVGDMYEEMSKRIKMGPLIEEDMIMHSKATDEWVKLNSPERLFGSAYRIVNETEFVGATGAKMSEAELKMFTDVRGTYAPLYQWMKNNKKLQHAFGERKVWLDLETKEVTRGMIAPIVADYGRVVVTPGAVTAGKTGFKVMQPGAGKITDLTPVEANAQFIWAQAKSGAGRHKAFAGGVPTKETEAYLRTDNLPGLTAAYNHIDWDMMLKQKRTLAVTRVNAKGEVLGTTNIADQQEMRNFIYEAKIDKIREMSAAGEQSRKLNELARYTDTTEAFVTAVQSGQSSSLLVRDPSHLFATSRTMRTKAGVEEFRPQYMEIRYDATTYDELGARVKGYEFVEKRMAAAESTRQAIIAENFGPEWYKHFDAMAGQKAQGITRASDTSTFLTSFQAEYDNFQVFVQSTGQNSHRMLLAEQERLYKSMESAAVAVKNDLAAVDELSVLDQSVLRSDHYGFLPDVMWSSENAASALPNAYQGLFKLLGVNYDERLQATLRMITPNTPHTGRIIALNALDTLQQSVDDALGRINARVMELFPVADEALEAEAQMAAAHAKAVPQMFSEWTNLVPSTPAGMALREKILQETATIQKQWDSFVATTPAKDSTRTKVIHHITNPTVWKFLQTQHTVNKSHIYDRMKNLARAENRPWMLDDRAIYLGRFNTEEFGHVAFVKMTRETTDPLTAKGTGMLIGKNADDLAFKVAAFRRTYRPEDATVTTTGDMKAFLRAKQEYQHEMAMTENSIDSTMRKNGALWDMAPQQNPNVAADIVGRMAVQQANTLRSTVAARYFDVIQTMRRQDDIINTHGYLNKSQAAKSTFQRNIDQMLAITDKDSHAAWYTVQEKMDKAISAGYYALRGSWVAANARKDWELLNKTIDKYGLPKVYNKSFEDWAMGNYQIQPPIMKQAVAQANGIFSMLALRLDYAHAMVTALSHPIMLYPETKALMQYFKDTGTLKPEALARLSDPAVTAKLWMQSTKNWVNGDPKVYAAFQQRALVDNAGNELRRVIDDVAFNPVGETAQKWAERVGDVAKFFAKPVDYSEQFVKFVAADVARQVLETAGMKESNPMYWAFIRVFQNKVHGNYYAAQRPGLFQGFAGQALGLFQTYQFNLFQGFFRHIGNKNVPAAAGMLGFQASTFGIQSLPGFQYLSDYMGKKTQGEDDFYSVIADSLPDPVANNLVYGLASGLTVPLTDGKGLDFYARGNLTPRTPILIPSKLEEVPVISMSMKMYDSLATGISNMANGAPAKETIMQMIAHNGVNRPMAGLAQLALGSKTTVQGTKMWDYHDMHWATAVAKSIGTRTMDEAVVSGAFYRSMAYRQARMDQLNSLGQAARTKMMDGTITGDDMNELMTDYVAKGGDQRNFKRWMQNNFANANEVSVYEMRKSLTTPEGRYLQKMMGASEFEE